VTGAQHYQAAEALLRGVVAESAKHHDKPTTAARSEQLRGDLANAIAQAQVHATLALAAATVGERDSAWGQVLR
jgi:hypothetical protein